MTEYPKDLDAERGLLGACILDPSRIAECLDAGLSPEQFSQDAHGKLWGLLAEMEFRGDAVDLVTVSDAMSAGGRPGDFGGVTYMVQLTMGVTATAATPAYTRIIMQHAERRRLLKEAEEVCAAAMRKDGDPSELWDRLSSAALDQPAESSGFVTVASCVDRVITGAKEAYDNPSKRYGCRRGLWT